MKKPILKTITKYIAAFIIIMCACAVRTKYDSDTLLSFLPFFNVYFIFIILINAVLWSTALLVFNFDRDNIRWDKKTSAYGLLRTIIWLLSIDLCSQLASIIYFFIVDHNMLLIPNISGYLIPYSYEVVKSIGFLIIIGAANPLMERRKRLFYKKGMLYFLAFALIIYILTELIYELMPSGNDEDIHELITSLWAINYDRHIKFWTVKNIYIICTYSIIDFLYLIGFSLYFKKAKELEGTDKVRDWRGLVKETIKNRRKY